MMKEKIFSMIACLPLLFVGCVRETLRQDSLGETIIRLSGNVTQSYQTKADAAGFADGDRIGVYVVDYNGNEADELRNDGNRADNVWFEFNVGSGSWTSAHDIYWKDSHTHADIYGYYPFTSVADVSALPFEVRRNQAEETIDGMLSGYEASDFLWGKTADVVPTSDVVQISFSHRLSMIRVVLEEGSGFASGEWDEAGKSVLVTGICRAADIDLATGTAYVKGNSDGSGIIPYGHDGEWRAVVIPQTVSAGTPLVSITVDGTPYKFSRDEDFTFVPSRQHNFTITVNKKPDGDFEFIPSEGGISAWNSDTESHGGTAKEYVVINVSEPGTLDKCVEASGKALDKIRNLKVTGKINARDFAVMKCWMPNLSALNLKEVHIVKTVDRGALDWSDYGSYWGTVYYPNEEYCLPAEAFLNKKTLITILLPEKLKAIEQNAFAECSFLAGSIVFPEGLESIAGGAFKNCENLSAITLPSTLISLGYEFGAPYDGPFANCTGLCCELILPEKLEVLGAGAFYQDAGLRGKSYLPEKLKCIGTAAFRCCRSLTGSLRIPQGITYIPDECFLECGFNGQIFMHDGIKTIGKRAFCGCNGLRGELVLPSELEVIQEECFRGCNFSGRLVLPKKLKIISKRAFWGNSRITGGLEFPDNVINIGAGAFAYCLGIEGVVFPESVETIQFEYGSEGTFEDCFGINRIVCKGVTPPVISDDSNVTGGHSVFGGVSKENFTVEVPEAAVPNYRTSSGWKDFKRISAYRNLSLEPHAVTALNTKGTRDFTLHADDEWEVEEQPGWVTLDRTSGKGNARIRLTFSRMPSGSSRDGKVVFRLKDHDYRASLEVHQYDYGHEEDEVIVLQEAARGKGVNVVILGEGYDAKDISDGKLLADVNETMEDFFDIEPYRTYRDYFNVYTGIAVSPESGVGNANTTVHNRFGTSATRGTLSGTADEILKYACTMPSVSRDNLGQTLIIIVTNTSDYSGATRLFDDGTAISYCPKRDDYYPYDFRGIVQHEAGGRGFGKLGDESVRHNAFVDACGCSCCAHAAEIAAAQAKGWYMNISLTAREDAVPWSHLLENDKYRNLVGIYEGASGHGKGVWRSEYNSCMNNGVPYYNTVSREIIVKRIMQCAGEEYSFENFVANDKVDNVRP